VFDRKFSDFRVPVSLHLRTFAMWDDSDEDDYFGGGGLSLQELARQNAESTQALLLSVEAKLYDDEGTTGGAQNPTLERDAGGGAGGGGEGGGEGAGDSLRPGQAHDDFGGFNASFFGGEGWGQPPPPPCHLNWMHFKNLRVRGYAVTLSNGAGASDGAAKEVSVRSLSGSPPPLPAATHERGASSGDAAHAMAGAMPDSNSPAAAVAPELFEEEILAIHGSLGATESR
jgi:hypothetical protein